MSSAPPIDVMTNMDTVHSPSLCYPGPVPSFGLPKPVLILVAHLLLNIKKRIKVQFLFIFLMQNQGYIMFLA